MTHSFIKQTNIFFNRRSPLNDNKFNFIEIKTLDNIGIITFNKPESLNVLCYQAFNEIEKALKLFELNFEIRVILINAKTGFSKNKKKIFSAGVNLKDYEDKFKLVKNNISKFTENLVAVRKCFSYIENHPKTIIAAVEGLAVGGAFELILCCDIILASKDSSFCLSEIKIGLIPGYGGIHRLEKIIGTKKAHYYLSLGEIIEAKEAYNNGIISKLTETSTFNEDVMNICYKLSKNSPNALSLLKNTFQNNKKNNPEKLEITNFLKAISHNDAQIGINSFLTKKTPEY